MASFYCSAHGPLRVSLAFVASDGVSRLSIDVESRSGNAYCVVTPEEARKLAAELVVVADQADAADAKRKEVAR